MLYLKVFLNWLNNLNSKYLKIVDEFKTETYAAYTLLIHSLWNFSIRFKRHWIYNRADRSRYVFGDILLFIITARWLLDEWLYRDLVFLRPMSFCFIVTLWLTCCCSFLSNPGFARIKIYIQKIPYIRLFISISSTIV